MNKLAEEDEERHGHRNNNNATPYLISCLPVKNNQPLPSQKANESQ